ncbi:hypothetical protein [uncultured Ruegeria sp.]|uniref:hypothetical protein n=1 Tax=uncultured Ruegeria sp. TaxID=259304 RepID=UPI002607F6CA|nr:hypothetical protein [uncultured Ruegeria sp.]
MAHLRAQDVSTRAFAAHWGEGHLHHKHLVEEARNQLVQLLSGEPAGSDKGICKEALIDLISAAIVNSNDIDATPESQAKAILEDILNNCLPLPAEATS